MLRDLSPFLFELGKPLKAGNWNTMVDASEELRRAVSHEHAKGERHVAGRFEQGFLIADWMGSIWGSTVSDRLSLVSTAPIDATRDNLLIELAVPFISAIDYGAFAVANNGIPVAATKLSNKLLGLTVPRPQTYPDVKSIKILVYGRYE